jgi:TPP-dependent pyruvate/acetoin dehydrogenase alpha subunit
MSDINSQNSLELQAYEAMYRARCFDDTTIALQRQGAVAGYASARGQEAAQCAVAGSLGPTDIIFPSYRQPGAALVMGVRPVELWRFHGRQAYCPWNWKQRRFFAYCIPVGSQLSHAVGWAVARRRLGAEDVSVVFFGDGSSSQGEVHEAMNLAGVLNAPTVFVCENNGWAISMPTCHQTAASTLHVRAFGYGFGGARVDGNDPMAVRHSTETAIRKARAGFGPTLIELVTHRLGGHTTSDNPALYRDEIAVEQWTARDPVPVLRRRLLAAGCTSEAVGEIEGRVDAQLRADTEIFLKEIHPGD